MKWERVESKHLEVWRAKVPGGWMVFLERGLLETGGAFFYPDPNHEWNGETLD